MPEQETLERARENARTLDELRTAADRAIDGLDKSLAIVTALLRIAAIEHGETFSGRSGNKAACKPPVSVPPTSRGCRSP